MLSLFKAMASAPLTGTVPTSLDNTREYDGELDAATETSVKVQEEENRRAPVRSRILRLRAAAERAASRRPAANVIRRSR